jgi:hypothetical protein
MVHIDSIRNVVGDKSICLESDGISDNEWLEAGEELQVGGMILARGILGVAAEWFAGVVAKGGMTCCTQIFTALLQNPPVAVRPARADIKVACRQAAACKRLLGSKFISTSKNRSLII